LKRFVAAICVATALFAAPAWAGETNPDIVHRHGIFKIASGHMTALHSILFLGHGATKDVLFHAQGIKDAFAHLGNAFPPGSGTGETKAAPAIWEQPEKFKKAGQDAAAATDAMVQAAQGDDRKAQIDAFKRLGGSCKACHDDFKSK